MLKGQTRNWLQELPLAVGVAALCFAVGFILSPWVAFSSAIPLFLCGLLLLAQRVTFQTAVATCVAATLSLDYFFTEPKYSFRVFSREDVAALCSFLVAVLFSSALTNRLAAKNRQLLSREGAQRALRRLAERSIQLDWREAVAEDICRSVRECFDLQSVCLWDAAASRLTCDGVARETEDGLRAAFMANQNVDAQRSCLYIRILRSGVRPIGCIQLRGQILEEATIGALVSLVSLTLERTRALSSEVAAQSESLSEGLRSTVLDSLAHSIKTPLTTIAVSVAGAAAIGGLSETQGRLLQGVQEQTERITSLTNRLLRTARLDAKMVVRFRDVDLADLVQASVRVDGDGKRIKLAGTEKPIAVSIDPDLLKMAIAQIVENAVKYSPPDSPVSVLLFTDQEEAFISIHNQGSFIPQAERSAIFQRFYRGQKPADCAPGTGLGLSVAKHAVEALGGVITVASDPEVGTTFTIQIPIQRRDG